ncbi:MAG: hypothetical protein KF861_09435, partial [Planctomycetaceae bacterium]|nr:hypothetical protein [Planctomycetaceae bacterium]
MMMTTSGLTFSEPKPGDLRSRSFVGLVLTQLLGAFNDNMLRWLVVPIAQQIPEMTPGTALALGGACFTLPYLLL